MWTEVLEGRILSVLHMNCFGRKSSVRYILSEGSQNILEVLKEMTAVMYIINEDDAEQRKNRDKWVKKPPGCVILGRWVPHRIEAMCHWLINLQEAMDMSLDKLDFLEQKEPWLLLSVAEIMSGGVREQAGSSMALEGR